MNRKWAMGAAIAVVLAAVPGTAQKAPLTTLSAIHALTNAEAAEHLPADFEATVTYYRDYEGTLFVQDGDAAIYVQPVMPYKLIAGDRVRIQGLTRESFRPFIATATITLLHHGQMPEPVPATFDDMIRARLDCRLVTIRARVLSADISLSSDRRGTMLEMRMDGGPVEAQLDSADSTPLAGLLDAEVEVTGAESGKFDGKMQMTGVMVHVRDLSSVKVLKLGTNPWTGPVTPMDEILSNYAEDSRSQRVRVQGTVTYYAPGSAVVLQNETKSMWVNTLTRDDIRIGDHVDATGFPDAHEGFLKLTQGEIADSHGSSPIVPIRVTWRDLTQSHHVFDLVSIEGTVVAEVREAGQDEYVLVSEGQLFSAILRHPARTSLGSTPLMAMKQIRLGSRVRVAGICILEDSNPFNAQVPFDVLLRSYDDVAVVARPSPLTVANLVRLVSVLAVVLLGVGTWGWMLNRKLQRQTAALAWRAKSEAAKERRSALIEQRRSRILEDINGTLPLAEVLEEITELVSFHLNGAPCWCEVTEGARLGMYQTESRGRRVIREEIPARTGPPLGVLYAALEPGGVANAEEAPALFLGTRLATLAIETRRLYSDLVHRSEFDLLTDIHNRFSLDKQMEILIAEARESAGMFGLIYVDLDEFKQVNDVYGHRVGDLYLQEVAKRMKRQLRSGDLLARLGGDEFAALVQARTRADVEEIAHRVEHCFRDRFAIEGCVIHGTASVGIALYPEDGTTKDSLLSTADAAMYVAKHTQKQEADASGGVSRSEARGQGTA